MYYVKNSVVNHFRRFVETLAHIAIIYQSRRIISQYAQKVNSFYSENVNNV